MAHAKTDTTPFYGLMAEFDSAQALMDAAAKTTAAGYTKKDAYSPFPIHGLAEALGFRERHVAPIVLGAAILGALGGWGLEYWTQVIDYPMDVGDPVGRSGRGVRHARAERPAAAVPPGLQRAALRPRDAGQVLPRDRSERPEVRPGGHARVPGEPEPT
jgi:hypothetical protein